MPGARSAPGRRNVAAGHGEGRTSSNRLCTGVRSVAIRTGEPTDRREDARSTRLQDLQRLVVADESGVRNTEHVPSAGNVRQPPYTVLAVALAAGAIVTSTDAEPFAGTFTDVTGTPAWRTSTVAPEEEAQSREGVGSPTPLRRKRVCLRRGRACSRSSASASADRPRPRRARVSLGDRRRRVNRIVDVDHACALPVNGSRSPALGCRSRARDQRCSEGSLAQGGRRVGPRLEDQGDGAGGVRRSHRGSAQRRRAAFSSGYVDRMNPPGVNVGLHVEFGR